MRRPLVLLLLFAVGAIAQSAPERYALILADPPAARTATSREQFQSAAVRSTRQRIQVAQNSLRAELQSRGLRVTGAVQTVLNAVFVIASRDREAELRNIPGVEGVVRLRKFRPLLNRAVQLVNAPAAWAQLGGSGNAGAGVKIAVIDTGIEQTHPAFQDPSLAAPAGFPKCQASDCDYTNSKVIVARSYVSMLAAGFPPGPENSRPDDLSPRDRIGHGTSVAMIAAGRTNTGPAATITGMAPKAYLGNYKVFGTPGVNGFSSGDAVISALDDALNDGMDIATLSLGAPSFTGPLDQGADCGESGNTPCDAEASAVESAIRAGMLVVSAAGNEGDTGNRQPTANTIDSPGTAPSAIAVGASTNSHIWFNSVRVPGSDAPSVVQHILADFGDGPLPATPFTAPMRDVAKVSQDATACAAPPRGSLTGTIALADSAGCDYVQKVLNLQDAGALGAILIQSAGNDDPFPPGGLETTSISTVQIGSTDGTHLRSFLASHPDHLVTLDPALSALDAQVFNTIASFSSRGPATGTGALKPEVVAVGTDLYMAAERTDPGGILYSATGYTVANGTSFSTPMVTGAAALVVQKHGAYSPAQIKSAVVNTATQDITDDNGSPARVTDVGAGKLDTAAAITANVTVEPSTLSFGILTGGNFPASQTLTLRNTGTGTVSLSFSLDVQASDQNGRLNLSATSMTLGAGQSGTLRVTLTGSLPVAGAYGGALVARGASTSLRVPYLYVVGDRSIYNAFILVGDEFDGTANQDFPDGFIALKVVDRYGVPVPGASVRWSVTQGGGTLQDSDAHTDNNGIAGAVGTLGPPGDQEITAQVGSLTVRFDGTARPQPTISPNGVVNAATFAAEPGIAPGSYISLFGTGLSDTTRAANRVPLPLSIQDVSVSFDVPQSNLSLPGRLYYVSATQVNVQVPWELRGVNSVLIKVSINQSSGQLFTAKVADYSPGIFAYAAGSTGQLIAAALDVNNQVINAANPANRGGLISFYVNGLGPVDNTPATGDPAPSAPNLARTLSLPGVTIGGQNAPVQFSGLAPGFSGLYQVNVTVPQNAGTGMQPVVVTINGLSSNTVSLPVQ
jgi:minor extracellular serine protease Vpr